MPILRAAADRGLSHTDAIASRHAFSSGDFHDPRWMGWGVLRVANEESLAPSAGIAGQRYANMEVLTLVASGQVRYGNVLEEGVLSAGDVHLLAAGSGIAHHIDNASTNAPARLLRFWIQPARVNAAPRSAAVSAAHAGEGTSTVIASPDGAGGSLRLGQSAWLRRVRIPSVATHSLMLEPTRRHWLQVVHGTVAIDGQSLHAGDALGYAEEAATSLAVVANGGSTAELLWFMLPA